MLELLTNFAGVAVNLAVAVAAFVGVAVAVWTARIPIVREEARRRSEKEQLASALIYEIRRALEHLKEGRKAAGMQKVIYTSEFQDTIFVESQREISEFGSDNYFAISAFYAQLRNVNYLRREFQRVEEKLMERDIQKLEAAKSNMDALEHVGKTLRACLDAGIHYAEQALDGMKSHAQSTAFTAALPPSFHTEEEKKILGLD